MAIYSIAVRTTNVTIANAAVEFRAVRRVDILEINVFSTAATAATFGFGRPANVPAGGTINLGQAEDPNAAVTTSGLVISGQTTAPTVPANFMQRVHFPGQIGAGIMLTWPERGGLRLAAGTSFVVWNITASPLCDITFRFDD